MVEVLFEELLIIKGAKVRVAVVGAGEDEGVRTDAEAGEVFEFDPIV